MSFMKKRLLNILKRMHNFRVNDPVKYCEAYKEDGCCFVDGPFCDMKDCIIRERYEKSKIDLCAISLFIR